MRLSSLLIWNKLISKPHTLPLSRVDVQDFFDGEPQLIGLSRYPCERCTVGKLRNLTPTVQQGIYKSGGWRL